jgi:Zn-dependent membrane protease YugP
MGFFFWDPTFILLIPAVVLGLYAHNRVRSTYKKFSQIPNSGGYRGSDVARALLSGNGIGDVTIERTEGRLSDHYDPRHRTLRLSPGVHDGKSIAALGIAAHEVGHAIQHRTGYAPLSLRHGLFPVASIGTSMAFPLFIGGLLFRIPVLMDIGILFFTGAVIFQLVTLPVEFNASKRALAQLQGGGFLVTDELQGARSVLNAAALTYVAATAMAVLNLLRLLLLRGRE